MEGARVAVRAAEGRAIVGIHGTRRIHRESRSSDLDGSNDRRRILGGVFREASGRGEILQ
jgi:hypothetical protein